MPELMEPLPYTGRPDEELATIKSQLLDLYADGRHPSQQERDAILGTLTAAEKIRLREIGCKTATS